MYRILAMLAAILVAGAAQAVDASSCYNLPADARAYCLARAHGDPGRCYAVQDPTLRAACLSEVRK